MNIENINNKISDLTALYKNDEKSFPRDKKFPL